MSFRMRNASGEWRHLEARATDLRADRHLRGVVINARDATERVRLEQELSAQSQRDSFAQQAGRGAGDGRRGGRRSATSSSAR